MKIGGLQKLTLIDYPGKLACTVFLAGCNFRCPWCYSSELVLPEKQGELPEISEKELFNFLKQRKDVLEGVVLCGGEPTIYQDLPQFCKKLKGAGYSVKLDTNGSNPEMLDKLINKKLVDYIAMDVKAPKEKYAEVVGFQGASGYYLLAQIEKSIELLKRNKNAYEFRTTVNPLLKREDVLTIAHWIRPAQKYFLQNFRPEKTIDHRFTTCKPYPEKELFAIQRAVAPFFETCQVR